MGNDYLANLLKSCKNANQQVTIYTPHHAFEGYVHEVRAETDDLVVLSDEVYPVKDTTHIPFRLIESVLVRGRR